MRKVFALGGINTDFVLIVSDFPSPGETVKAKKLVMNPGGKGANQAVAAARMGVPVYAIGKVGNDSLADVATSTMRSSSVKLDFVYRDEKEPTGIALIFVKEDGENCIGFYPGATLKLTEEEINRALQVAEEGDILMSSFEVVPEIAFYAFKVAKSKGMFTILNPAPVSPIPEEILDFIDILTPNEVEAAELLKVESLPSDYESVFKIAKDFIGSRTCSMVITLGEKGCLYVTKDTWELIPALKVRNVVDTTAAGDAFSGALAASIAKNRDILECLQIANIAGAVCVTKIGAQESMPYASEVEDIFKKGLKEI